MTFEEISQFFESNSIDCSMAGFHSSPEFLALEKKWPLLLETYAEYVSKRQYDGGYLAQAEQIVTTAAQFIHSEAGQKRAFGRCRTMSMWLSGFLDRHQIWNFMIVGALKGVFKAKGRVMAAIYFRPTSQEESHTWVVAPPFLIVDVTLNLQQLTAQERTQLECPVVEKTAPQASISGEFLIEGADFLPLSELRKKRANWFRVMDKFPPRLVEQAKATLIYTPCAISMSDGNLADLNIAELLGKDGLTLALEAEKHL